MLGNCLASGTTYMTLWSTHVKWLLLSFDMSYTIPLTSYVMNMFTTHHICCFMHSSVVLFGIIFFLVVFGWLVVQLHMWRWTWSGARRPGRYNLYQSLQQTPKALTSFVLWLHSDHLSHFFTANLHRSCVCLCVWTIFVYMEIPTSYDNIESKA